jgi:glucan phosphoethanolaminetransferase (alkaline phosphatase superfamily)
MGIIRRVLLDAGLWLAAPAIFLAVYVQRDGAPAASVLPHLWLLLVAFAALALFRLLLACLIPHDVVRRAAATIVLSAALAVMLAYYALTLVGMQAWGRVVSWDLIASYAPQALQLADAFGIGAALAIGVLVVACLTLLAAVWFHLRRFDWTRDLVRHAPRLAVPALLIVGSALCIQQVLHFAWYPPAAQSEPLSLTFFPMEGAWHLHGHAVDRLSAARQDAKEDEARAAYPAVAARGGRNLVLIVVDALRADHMSVFGYGRDTTPNLSRLERAGQVRKAASTRSSCGSSTCGLLSLSSSKFIHQFSMRPILLHEILRRHGYRVHMILSGDHASFYGLREAYGALDSYYDGRSAASSKYVNDDQVVQERLAALPQWDGGAVMLQLHLMSAHVLGRWGKAPPPGLFPPDPGGRSSTFVDTYDFGVRRADAEIAKILQVLQDKGYLGNALVAVTADHGEALGEHGLYNHTNSVREEVLKIPFMLISYGEAPRPPIDRAAFSAQVDIAPTLLAELGFPRPSTWAGEPLQQGVSRQLSFFQERDYVGLFDHRDPAEVWKYWINTRSGEEFAFNLRRDPGERTNVLGEVAPARLREWRVRALPGASLHTVNKAL